MVSKSDVLKIAAGAIVLFFVLEAFAYTGMRNLAPAQGGNEPGTTPTPVSAKVLGTAEFDATVSSYPDGVLMVSGPGAASDQALLSELNGMQSEGKVAYYNPAGENSVNVVVAGGADMADAAKEVARGFPSYTVSSKAQLDLPQEIVFATSRGNVTAQVRLRATMQMEPFARPGENVSVRATAFLVEDAVEEIQVGLSESTQLAFVEGTIASLSPAWGADAEVAWENRTAVNITAVEEALSAYPNKTVDYAPKGIIQARNISQEQAALLRNLSYVILVAGDTAVVKDGFTDRALAESDFESVLGNGTEISFPSSQFSLNVTGEGLNESAIRELVGIGGLRVRREGLVQFPEGLKVGGKDYFLAGGALVPRSLDANATEGGKWLGLVQVQVKGARAVAVR